MSPNDSLNQLRAELAQLEAERLAHLAHVAGRLPPATSWSLPSVQLGATLVASIGAVALMVWVFPPVRADGPVAVVAPAPLVLAPEPAAPEPLRVIQADSPSASTAAEPERPTRRRRRVVRDDLTDLGGSAGLCRPPLCVTDPEPFDRDPLGGLANVP
jgi:hypothetical protein